MKKPMRNMLVVTPMVAMLFAGGSGDARAQNQVYVDFNKLAGFSYDPADPWALTPAKREPTGVPAEIQALDGKRIAIIGLGLPLTWGKEGASEFLLTISEDACLFGATPRINEWIMVTMVGGRTVEVWNGGEYWAAGKFHVTEKVEDGKVIQLFELEADSVRFQRMGLQG